MKRPFTPRTRLRIPLVICVAAVAVMFGCKMPGMDDDGNKPMDDDGNKPKKTGSLSVTSDPHGADIYLNSDFTGKVTPYTFERLTADRKYSVLLILESEECGGRHTVTVSADQTATAHHRFAIPPSELAKLNLGLEAVPAETYARMHISDIGTPASGLPTSSTYPILPLSHEPRDARELRGVGYRLRLEDLPRALERGVTTGYVMSPAFIYNQLNGGLDFGIQIYDALDLLLGLGVSTWDSMPYNPADHVSFPSAAAYAEALEYRITYWDRVPIEETAIKSHLAQGNPVVIGIPVHQDFDDLSETNPIYNTNCGEFRGLHALLLVGYDDALSAYKVLNSWAPDRWGLDGYGWIDYDKAASEGLIREAYYTVDDVTTGPTPTPIQPVFIPDVVVIAGDVEGTVLTWEAQPEHTSFDVFLGTDQELTARDFQANVTEPQFTPFEDLTLGTTYFWRVDARSPQRITRGPVWSFVEG